MTISDEMKDIVKRMSNWYFSKRVLPYWGILLLDSVIVFISAVFTFWVSNRSQVTYDSRYALVVTALLYAVLSWPGARVFKTYSGVLRYSSFVDLLKLTYANLVTLALALAVSLVADWQGISLISALSPLSTVMTFLLSTLLMWAPR